MPTFAFHNNYHRSNHHTVHLSGFPESSSDPIASLDYPFLGIFYNNYYDTSANFLGQSNSFDWWSVHTTTSAQSAIWELFPTTYTTVKENSGFQPYNEVIELNINQIAVGAIAYGDNKFVGFLNNSLSAFYSLNDGKSWTITRLSSAGFSDIPIISKVDYVNGKFIALGSIGTNGFYNSFYSNNGINWIPFESPKGIIWRSIAYGNNIYIAHGNNTNYAYSTNSLTWFTNQMPIGANSWYTIFDGDKFVSISDTASAAYSIDGLNWNLVKIPVDAVFNDLTYANNTYIATSNTLSGAYSYDGTIWQPNLIVDGDIGSSSNIGTRRMPFYDGEKFVVFQTFGALQNLMASYDGINFWKRYPQFTYRMANNSSNFAHNKKGVAIVGRIILPLIPNASFYLWKTNTSQWSKNINVYNTYNPVSSNWISYANTVSEYGDYWNNLHNEFRMYDDIVQENTAQKTFSALEIQPQDISNITWDLTAGQVLYYIATDTSNFSGYDGAKKGGLYNLILVTDATCNSGLKINFNPEKFKFFNNTYSYSVTGIHVRKFEFLYDGTYMCSNSGFLYDVNPPDGNVYNSGGGIILYLNNVSTNTVILNQGDTIAANFGGGLFINGSEPYVSGIGVNVDKSLYNRDFLFSFTTQNALCAISPYGQLGSQDRIDILNPYLSATNATTTSNTINLNKCKSYDAIKITTKAYGYISQLIVNDVEITNITFPSTGFNNHETGHIITANPNYDDVRTQEIFVKFGNAVPILPTLSSGISLWLDALDYSSVNKLSSESGNNYILGLSSKILSNSVYFSSLSSSNNLYNLQYKQSFNYNLSSTHYRDLILSGNNNFATFTVMTPLSTSENFEWIWTNGNCGIFKIPNTYSLGIGNSAQYYTYNYGVNNLSKSICIATRYLSATNSQLVYINGSGILDIRPVSAIFDDTFNNYTMIGGYNPLSGYSRYKLHELIFYKGLKNNAQIEEINNYLIDKWKITV